VISGAIRAHARKLISDSSVLSGLRVLLAMSFTFIPSLFSLQIPFLEQGSLYISISLCLGVMASAIVEVDDNVKNKQKFIGIILICFFIASSSVELLFDSPFLFALGLFTSSFVFMMFAVLGTHYNKVGFGALLIAMYTMIGHQPDIAWYEQPITLTLGALCYGEFSILWHFLTPYHALREHLAQLLFSLSRYHRQKAALFSEFEGRSKKGRFNIRQQLAGINIPIVSRLSLASLFIRSRLKINHKQKNLQILNQYLMIAEKIHERISASQFLYSNLEQSFKREQFLEGYYQLLLQLSDDCYQLGLAINDNKIYQHSRRLKWTIKALEDQLFRVENRTCEAMDGEGSIGLHAIFSNLKEINALLLHASNIETIELPKIIVKKESKKKTISFWGEIGLIISNIKQAIIARSTVYTHAVRISISLVIAYGLQLALQLDHGFWLLLTVLFVCQPSFSETRKRLTQRTLGTFFGILLGYPILLYVDSLFVQVLFLIASAFLFFSYLGTNYGLSVVFITLFVMFIFNILTGTGIEIMPYRLLETFLGCLLSFLAITFIFPDWQSNHAPLLVKHLLKESKLYFTHIAAQYQFGTNESSAFTKARFDTFQANAQLTSAWKSMLFEPTSKQKVNEEVNALVNRCDALVSYIAALSSHRRQIENFENNNPLNQLLKDTEKQISLARCSNSNEGKIISVISSQEFEIHKQTQPADTVLIVEQLRLIAFTALDIQVLLQEVERILKETKSAK